jgi:hypothetical protein
LVKNGIYFYFALPGRFWFHWDPMPQKAARTKEADLKGSGINEE